MTTIDIDPNEDLSEVGVRAAVVANYNAHKNEKNAELTFDEVSVFATVDDGICTVYILTTGRNDGLIYLISMEPTGHVTLSLYNRIARKVLNEGTGEEVA